MIVNLFTYSIDIDISIIQSKSYITGLHAKHNILLTIKMNKFFYNGLCEKTSFYDYIYMN